MKYRQLEKRIRTEFGRNDYLLSWDVSHGIEISYNIIPLPFGTFIIHSSTGRGGWGMRYDSDSLPLVFTSEDDVCDYIWQQLTRPKPEPVAFDGPANTYTAEELEAKKQRLRAVLEAQGPPPYPNEFDLNGAIHTYFARGDRAVGMQAVSDTATESNAHTLVLAVAAVISASDTIVVDVAGHDAGERFRTVFRAIAAQNRELDSASLSALAERWCGRRPLVA